MEVVSFMRKNKRAGVVVTIDFEKCFDRIEYKSIRGAFEYFGFGTKFIDMMFLLFTNLQLCTSSNGYFSRYFCKERGNNQGDPASPLIYCFCGEVMAHLLYDNANIQGLDVNGIKQLLSQFVDDTAVFLKFEPLEIQAFTEVLQHVEAQMGLKVSYDKTTIY